MPVWPQDILTNPVSNRRNVDPVLATLTDREFFSYTEFQPTVPAIANRAMEFLFTHIVDQSYNFWLANIEVLTITSTTGVPQAVGTGILELIDNETGRRFVRGNVGSFSINTSIRGARSTMSKPYVIRAGQSFTSVLKTPPLTVPLSTIYAFSFEGWKDFSY